MRETSKQTAATFAELSALLAACGQGHLLAFWEEISDAARRQLADEIRGINFGEIERLLAATTDDEDYAAMADRAQSPPAIRLDGENPHSLDEARHRGEEAIAAGAVGVILVAGGQGSRLGFEHPKGMFSIGPVSGASLLQIHMEKIVATSRRYDADVPLYVMTSPATDAETREFLASSDWFGLAPESVRVFCQGTMPAADAQSGKLLLADRHRLFLSPDGHGGMLPALADSGALADMAARGLKQLFYFQVDNPLAQVADPALIGYHLLAGSEYSLQVVAKTTPDEPLGNVVSVDAQVRVIEYSDLPDEAAGRRTADGSLALWAGSIAVHVFDAAFLTRMAGRDDCLPVHRALKKVPHINADGRRVDPDAPNAIKFERFIFDLLPEARAALAVEVDAAEAFAPLKNAPGAECDTPEAVRRQMIELHRRWLIAAGAKVPQDVDVEISPLFALDAGQLAERIAPGTAVLEHTYFC